MIITCVEPIGIPQAQFENLRKEFESAGHTFRYYMDRNETPAVLVERMHDAHIVVVSNIKLSQNTLEQCPNLQYLSVAFTGLDHIDLDYCRMQGIVVQNAAGYSTTAVSELSVGLMLDLLRRITSLDGVLRQGGSRGTFLGRELKGKTVGVVGTGAIGTATIRLLQAFGANVVAYNRSEHDDVKALGVPYTTLTDLLKASDIVTLHTPLTQETHHLIGKDQLRCMKPTALLINTARGNVCDIPAVAKALCDGRIAGAAFDVYEAEPPLSDSHPLLHAPNCICVPHVGYATRESFDMRADIVFDHVKKYLTSKQK